MTRRTITKQLRYYFQYVPFTVNTLLFALVTWFVYKVLYKPLPKKPEEPSPFLPFILLMAKLAFWFMLALIAVSVLSAVATWLYYLWLKKKKGNLLQLAFTTETKHNKKPRLFLNAKLEGAFRPLLGFVKGRLFYDHYEMTDTFNLQSNKRKEKSLWRAAITGKNQLELPDIKEYELKGGFLFFQDMLHLFSFPVAQPLSGQFYQPPVLKEENEANVFPKKTETLDVRIDQLRRVEGEYLNYKDFESGDDVRRIVWKVYAKNRDLVVRIPELYEPFASHLYFYASFFADVKNQWLAEGYLKEMLNYYKNYVWTIYDTLSKKEFEMRYLPDQEFHLPELATIQEKNLRIISNSQWQQSLNLSSYFDAKKGAVLCLSSFTDIKDLKNVLEKCDQGTVIYFIKCSEVFRNLAAWSFIKRFIFLPPKDRLSKLRARWIFSPLRGQIKKKEKEIEELLQKSSASISIL